MNSRPSSAPLVTKLSPYLPILEKILIIALIVGAILAPTQNDKTVLSIAFVGLAVVFFLSAFQVIEVPSDEQTPMGFKELLGLNILPKVMWIGSAAGAIGIASYLMQLNNEGYKRMLMIGGGNIALSLLVLAFLSVSGTRNLRVVTPILLRAVPLAIACFYLLFT